MTLTGRLIAILPWQGVDMSIVVISFPDSICLDLRCWWLMAHSGQLDNSHAEVCLLDPLVLPEFRRSAAQCNTPHFQNIGPVSFL